MDEPTTSKRSRLEVKKSEIEKLIKSKSDQLTYQDLSNPKWSIYERIFLDNKETIYLKCKKCPSIFKYDTQGSAALNNHLKSHDKKNNHTITTTLDPQPVTKDKNEMADALAFGSAHDLRPFSMCEGIGFQAIIDCAIKIGHRRGPIKAKALLPRAQTVRNHTYELYDKLKIKIAQTLVSVDNINCTTDHWTETTSNTSFLAITIHYASGGKIFQRIIGTFEVADKTAFTTKDNFVERLDIFNLESKVRIVTTDNHSANYPAFKNYIWIGCSAHNLALVQKHVFEFTSEDRSKLTLVQKSILELILNCKDLVQHVKRTNINCQLDTKLKQSCPTRWDSNVDMLISISSSFEELEDLAVGLPDLREHLKKINKETIDSIIKILMPFKNFREDLCQDNNPTMHLVTLVKTELISQARSNINDSQLIAEIKSRIITYVKSHFHVKPVHVIATLLAPGFKDNTYNYKWESVTKDFNLEKDWKILFHKLCSEIPESDNEDNEVDSSASASTISSSVYSKYKTAVNVNDFEKVDEFTRYQNYPLTLCERDMCPIKFWEEKKHIFPRLSKIASWILSAPATSAASERTFSAAGFTMNDRRKSLLPETLDKLLFIRSNMSEYINM